MRLFGSMGSRKQARTSSPTAGRPQPSRPPRSTELRIERLEDRLALSGFGTGDGAYIVEPWNGQYNSVAIQPTDQKIVAAGNMQITNPNNTTEGRMAIARYDALGNSDTAFGSGGVSAPALGPGNENGSGLVIQSDGRAVVSGEAGTAQVLAVTRFTANGSLDSGFGNGGWNNFNVQPGSNSNGYAVGRQSTGTLVVSGATTATTDSAFVAGFTSSGAIDSGKGGFGQVVQGNKATGANLATFGSNAYNYFSGVAIQPDNKVLVVGSTGNGNTVGNQLVIARYTALGVPDTTFNHSGYAAFLPAGLSYVDGNAVALESNGQIVVAGTSSGIDGRADMFLARFNANGSLDTTFGAGAGYVRFDIDGTTTQTGEIARGVVIEPDGKIVAAGVQGGSGVSNVLVARLNADGSLDQTFGTGGFKLGPPPAGQSFVGNAVSLESDGSIIVAGYADATIGSTPTLYPLLMRFSGVSNAAQATPSIATASLSIATASNTAAATDAALLLVIADGDSAVNTGAVSAAVSTPDDDPLAASTIR